MSTRDYRFVLAETSKDVLANPPYSLDLIPSDFYPFKPLPNYLKATQSPIIIS